jgi:hypothetical protein
MAIFFVAPIAVGLNFRTRKPSTYCEALRVLLILDFSR